MMNSTEILSVYETVGTLTGQMLDAAGASDWDRLVLLQARCSEHVQSLREGEPAEALDQAARRKKVEIIKQILEHDRQIRDLTTPWMARLSALINSAGTQRRLADAYGPAR